MITAPISVLNALVKATGVKCKFPFRFHDTSVCDCLNTQNGESWCSKTEIYDGNDPDNRLTCENSLKDYKQLIHSSLKTYSSSVYYDRSPSYAVDGDIALNSEVEDWNKHLAFQTGCHKNIHSTCQSQRERDYLDDGWHWFLVDLGEIYHGIKYVRIWNRLTDDAYVRMSSVEILGAETLTQFYSKIGNRYHLSWDGFKTCAHWNQILTPQEVLTNTCEEPMTAQYIALRKRDEFCCLNFYEIEVFQDLRDMKARTEYNENRSEYMLIEYATNWTNAFADCERQYGRLIVVEDDSQQNHVKHLIGDADSEVWIGARFKDQWSWESNSCPANQHQLPSVSHSNEESYCLKMSGSGTWLAENCSLELPYVCFFLHQTHLILEKSPAIFREGENGSIACHYPKGIKCCFCTIILYWRSIDSSESQIEWLTKEEEGNSDGGVYHFPNPLHRTDSAYYNCYALHNKEDENILQLLSLTSSYERAIRVQYMESTVTFKVFYGTSAEEDKEINLEDGVNLYVKAGQIVTFVCHAGPGEPSPTVTFRGDNKWLSRISQGTSEESWWHPGMDINDIEEAIGSGFTVIKHRVREVTMHQNNMVLTCVAYHPITDEITSTPIRLHLLVQPILSIPNNTVIHLDTLNSVELHCKIETGNPNIFNITWLKDGKLIESKLSEETLHKYQLLNVKKSDAGNYSCLISNTAGENSITYQVDVHGSEETSEPLSSKSAQKKVAAGVTVAVLLLLMATLLVLYKRGILQPAVDTINSCYSSLKSKRETDSLKGWSPSEILGEKHGPTSKTQSA